MCLFVKSALFFLILIAQGNLSLAEETLVTTEPKDIYPFAINSSHLIQGQFPTETILTVIERESGWLKVRGYVGDKECVGWVKDRGLISKTESQQLTTHQLDFDESVIGYALTEDFPVYLRIVPEDSATIIHIIQNSSVVRIIGTTIGWYRVEAFADGKRLKGWIPSSHALFSKDAGSEEGFKEAFEKHKSKMEELEKTKQLILMEKERMRRQRVAELEEEAKQISESNYEDKIAVYTKLSQIDPDNASHKDLIQVYTDKRIQRQRRVEERKQKEALKTWRAKIDALPDSEYIKIAVRERKICIGMSADAVLLSWGKPDDKNTSVYSWGRHEQWIYRHGDYKSDYLYFENGILRSYQLEGR